MSFGGTLGPPGIHYRSRTQTLFIVASSSSHAQQDSYRGIKRQKSTQAGTSVPPRRSTTGKQKTEAIPLTLEPPALDSSQQLEQMDFDEFVAESDVPILVDFYAPWCGPCQLMSKVVTDISQELKGRMKVVKINTDAYPKLASKYRVQKSISVDCCEMQKYYDQFAKPIGPGAHCQGEGLPTCLLFRDGSVIDRVDGFMPGPTFGKRVRFYVSRLDVKFGRR